jgi:hypothetical protein
VQGQGEVIWWGGDCFYRYREGGLAEPLGKGIISRFLTDSDFGAGAIKRVEPQSMASEDQLMIGAYDPRSGIFVWSYQGPSDAEWKHSRAVLYNPAEDRWALIDAAGLNLAAITQLPNTTTSESAELAGLIGLDWDGVDDTTWFQFIGTQVYAASFRTKTFAIQLDEAERPLNVQIEGVIPVFSDNERGGSGAFTSVPRISVLVEMGMDPRLGDGYQSETYNTIDNADQRKMLPFRLSGAWAKVTVNIDEMQNVALDNFEGLYIHWNVRGTGGA